MADQNKVGTAVASRASLTQRKPMPTIGRSQDHTCMLHKHPTDNNCQDNNEIGINQLDE
jgi:hypothetical protein